MFIRSYHGKRLDTLATEVRRLLVKFPNVTKIVVDCRGLGDAFPAFMSQPWTDPETNKEYPPIVPDNEKSLIHNAVPLLHEVIANNVVNNQMVSATTIALERQALEIPINSRFILENRIAEAEEGDDESAAAAKRLTQAEKAIYIEADALQIEMGNIIARTTGAGSIVYDVAKSTQHKDRYSALGMALNYINSIEEDRRRKIYQNANNMVIGVVTRF